MAPGKVPAIGFNTNLGIVETRVLTVNADPVFQDQALAILDQIEDLETQIVRNLSEAVQALLEENFDGLIIEGDAALAVEQATNLRQHFPSLTIACLLQTGHRSDVGSRAKEQNIELLSVARSNRRLRATLTRFVRSLGSHAGTAAEGIDPCHSLIGNLNQFSAAEILQMSCLSQRSGRFTFKSGRGNSEIYLQQGSVRHAVFGSVEGEAAVAEIFRWRQGRFYFEEGIISQEQTVNRPWAHLLIDNLQKLDETLELVSV
ncbi:MAG TPA: DUF4388 domain-containing protein [Chthoniobacterales bacterium]|nr:DUF4388 domain-containing protein [Chthoniobacterales bacterium]